MVEITMGKISGHYKTVVFFICLLRLALLSAISTAALQEDELFEKAYEYYLSYQPAKALEYCDIFLNNFPDSSAKDAVLFWKAKSLMQLKRTEEAVKIFSQIRETAPESLFVPFIDKELSSNKNGFYVFPGNDLPVDLKVKTEEKEREKQEAETLLKNLAAEKAVTAEKLKENESRLAALEEELKKERSRMAELTGRGDRAETLGARSEIASLKDIIKQYETPVLQIGENQFSWRQILEDHRESSEVMRKIHAHNIIWSHDSPYDDFIIEHVLLKKAGESGITEDKVLYNSLLKQYSLSEKEKDYLLRYLIINNLIKKKLSEIIADESLIRKDYEINKEKYIKNTEINQVKILSLKYSPREELEKSLEAVDFQHQVSSGKSLETVYKYNSNVLSFEAVNVSDLPDFVKERVGGLKDGEMSNIIAYDNKFMILQMQRKKKEYRSYEDVYKEFREKALDDPAAQTYLLQEWFNELRKEAGPIK